LADPTIRRPELKRIGRANKLAWLLGSGRLANKPELMAGYQAEQRWRLSSSVGTKPWNKFLPTTYEFRSN
jgi:hypothetical protein